MLDAEHSLAAARVSGTSQHVVGLGIWLGPPGCSRRNGHPHIFPLIEIRGRKPSFWEKLPLFSLGRAMQGEAERRRNYSGAVTPARHCWALRGRQSGENP